MILCSYPSPINMLIQTHTCTHTSKYMNLITVQSPTLWLTQNSPRGPQMTTERGRPCYFYLYELQLQEVDTSNIWKCSSEIILASLCTWRKEEEYLVMQDNWIWCERWKAKGKKRKPWMGWMGNVKRTLHIRRMSVEQGDWWSIRNERWCSQHDYDRSSHAFGPISNDWFRCGEEDWIHYDIVKVNQCCCSTLLQNNPDCTEYWPHSVVSGHWSPLP